MSSADDNLCKQFGPRICRARSGSKLFDFPKEWFSKKMMKLNFRFYIERIQKHKPGRVAQSVTCLATDACLTADPGVASSIPARYHTFVEIYHEIISTVILLLPLIYSRRIVVSYKRKYVHKLLVNRLLKPAQEKV